MFISCNLVVINIYASAFLYLLSYYHAAHKAKYVMPHEEASFVNNDFFILLYNTNMCYTH